MSREQALLARGQHLSGVGLQGLFKERVYLDASQQRSRVEAQRRQGAAADAAEPAQDPYVEIPCRLKPPPPPPRVGAAPSAAVWQLLCAAKSNALTLLDNDASFTNIIVAVSRCLTQTDEGQSGITEPGVAVLK